MEGVWISIGDTMTRLLHLGKHHQVHASLSGVLFLASVAFSSLAFFWPDILVSITVVPHMVILCLVYARS